jgi:hypothetical protein
LVKGGQRRGRDVLTWDTSSRRNNGGYVTFGLGQRGAE